MKCFYHHDTDAVALCKNCQRGLCPGCAADLADGTACKERCEVQVAAINEVMERNKTGYQKAGSAYARNAIVYFLLGAMMCLIGALTLPTGYVMIALGVVMFIGAGLSYSSGRKMRQIGP